MVGCLSYLATLPSGRGSVFIPESGSSLPEIGFTTGRLLIFQRLITWRRDCLEEKRRSRVDQGIWGVASIRVGFRQAPHSTAGLFLVRTSTASR